MLPNSAKPEGRGCNHTGVAATSGDYEGQSGREFSRLSNIVVRDKRLSDTALVLLLYRTTFVGNYALNITALLRRRIVRGPGLGRDVIERGIAQLSAAGYLKRWQPPSTGDRSFGYCRETLTLPPCGSSGKAGRVVYRKWFDGQLSVQEMAAYAYLRAGTGKGPWTYAREIEDRFGWSRPTGAKVIKALIEFRLVAKRVGENSKRSNVRHHLPGVGADPVGGTTAAYENSEHASEATVKKPGHEPPGHENSGHQHNRTPPHTSFGRAPSTNHEQARGPLRFSRHGRASADLSQLS